MEQDKEILEALADVSEDLAIEILSEFTAEDYPHLDKTASRLIKAAAVLEKHKVAVPFSVQQVLRNFKASLH